MPLPEQNRNAEFGATRWSVVLAAGQSHSPETAAALEKLCRADWYPLYAFVRRQGHREHEAQDLTQDFFTKLLEKRSLRSADPNKGKFRSFPARGDEEFPRERMGPLTGAETGWWSNDHLDR